ncbi:MAG: DUF2868 domain-containing protein [Gammaproteobacteria bacterium]
MSHEDRPQTLFFDAVAIPTWLERDDDRPLAERVARERDLARHCAHDDELRRVRAWWQRVRDVDPDADPAHAVAARVTRLRRLVGLVVTLAALLAGCSASLAVFHYDGSTPVNVVTVLALLVAAQLALLAGSLLLMLPQVRGLGHVQELLASINPGHYALHLLRRLARRGARVGWQPASGPLTRHWMRWQILSWSQQGAVAFNLGALAAAAALIVFTDLAFGWGTTLDVDAAAMLAITDALAWPWRELWPAAVPDAALIESSRIFRLDSAPVTPVPARALTGWWPFLLCALVIYALLPRVALLALARLRLRASTRRLLMDDARVRALLDRMREPVVEFTTSTAEAPVRAHSPAARGAAPAATHALAIVWADALADAAAVARFSAATRHHVTRVLRAGGSTIDADQATLGAAAAASADAILVIVRGWEAPLLDLQDFLAALRARGGPDQALVLVPVGIDGAPPTAAQRATWARWVGRLDDAGIHLDEAC